MQTAWVYAMPYRAQHTDTELPPITAEEKQFISILEEYGYEFDWTSFYYFLSVAKHLSLSYDNIIALKKCCTVFKNAIQEYAEEGADPPYMSAEYAAKREKAKQQAQKFNEDKALAQKGQRK